MMMKYPCWKPHQIFASNVIAIFRICLVISLKEERVFVYAFDQSVGFGWARVWIKAL